MSRATVLAALFAIVVVLGGAGCTRPRTEAVVVVTVDGVRVPDDVDKITFTVADATDAANPIFQKDFRLCGGDVVSDCLTLPLNFTLIPGSHRDHSSRIQVTATRRDATVIDNAALFTFAEGQSLRLDFVLYANCLGVVDCAARDQVCGPDAMCVPVPSTPIHGDPDLSVTPADLGAGDDLSVPDDLSLPADMAMIADMRVPNDLTPPPDFAGCVPLCPVNTCGISNCGTQCTCSGATVCSGTSCVACGNATEPCCSGGLCSSILHCYGSAPGTCDYADMAMSGGGTDDMGSPDKVLTWSSAIVDSGTFYGIWYAAASHSAYAVGDKGTVPGVWMLTNGTPLAFVNDPGYTATTTLRSVYSADGSDVWAAGDAATIVRKTGGTWAAPVPPSSLVSASPLKGIWVGPPGTPSVHAVGGTINGGCTDPAIDAHFNGTNWMAGSVASGCAFGAVWGNNLGFVAWPANEHKIVWTTDDHAGNEFSYSFQVTSSIYLHGIWGLTTGQMWVVGDSGTIYKFGVDKFNNGNSQLETSNTTVQLNAVSGSGGSDLWAVGNSGTVLHSTGNAIWTKQTNVGNSFQQLYGVWAGASNDVYIVGSEMGQKVILHGQ